LQAGLHARESTKEIPRKQRLVAPPALGGLFSTAVLKNLRRRNEAIRRAHAEDGYSLSEIDRVVRLHYSTISRIVNRGASGQDAQDKI
jgi:hypothetical protein